MQATELEKIIITILEDAKATEIKALDVRKLTSVTEVMIICSGRSERHVRSIAERVAEEIKKIGIRPLGVTGLEHSEWAIVDLNDVIVHVMLPEARERYDLENLWMAARNNRNSAASDEN